MTEPKFTPGPWNKFLLDGYCEGGAVWAVCYANKNTVFNICYCADGGIKDEDFALIAAAPDLYEALDAYDKAEADILENANWYTESGVPQITQEQFDRLVDCQTLKAKALRKARGEE